MLLKGLLEKLNLSQKTLTEEARVSCSWERGNEQTGKVLQFH